MSYTPNYDISKTTVSCEAITDNLSLFNGIQFYSISNNNGVSSTNSFNMYSQPSQITSTYYNVSVTFQLSTYNYQLYTPGANYMCCTTLDSVSTGQCTQVYLFGNTFIVIPTNPPVTTTSSTTVAQNKTSLVTTKAITTTVKPTTTTTTLKTLTTIGQTTMLPLVGSTTTIYSNFTRNHLKITTVVESNLLHECISINVRCQLRILVNLRR